VHGSIIAVIAGVLFFWVPVRLLTTGDSGRALPGVTQAVWQMSEEIRAGALMLLP
jgi:hypothetical protein